MWKKMMAFIMIICLVTGFWQSSVAYAGSQETLNEEALHTQEVQSTKEDKQNEVQKQEVVAEQDTCEQDNVEVAEPQNKAVSFQEEMTFSGLNSLARGAAGVVENNTVSVFVYRNDEITQAEVPTGFISDNIPKKEGTTEFIGAYVVTDSGEDEIAYIGSYTDADGAIHIYYAFDDDASTGILLKEGQYIKLVYKDTLNLTYQIQLEDGTLCEDGGVFYDMQSTVAYGNNVRIQFKASKGTANGDYSVIGVKAIAADGTESVIDLDEDGYGYLNQVTQNVNICAVIKKIGAYRLVVDNQNHGHVCWAGHAHEENSNVADPYGVAADKFCSYRVNDDGTIDTVTANPGGTIYFVMYSQTSTGAEKWEFKNLRINGVNVEMIFDKAVHSTDLGNGMTAYFRYLGKDYKDSHLARTQSDSPDLDKRSKFECWVEQVSSDIHVNFECYDSKRREILTLGQADGIESVCGSSFDRQNVGGDYLHLGTGKIFPQQGYYDFWKDIYDPVSNIGEDIMDVEYNGVVDSPYARSFWGNWEPSWFFSKRARVEVQSDVFATQEAASANKTTSEWGSRYIYFKTKAGYDPSSLEASITGKGKDGSGIIPVDEMGDISHLVSSEIKSYFYRAKNNPSLSKARDAGYQWYIHYLGCGINMRNLYLKCNPYQFEVEYDLNGGTLDGSDSYKDSKKYSIVAGNNKISIPSSNPVQAGKVFDGWKLEAVNEGSSIKNQKLYDAGTVFKISEENFEAALETEKVTYSIPDDNLNMVEYTDYIPVSGGKHRFRFVAQWSDVADVTAPKAEYMVSIYKEVAQGTAQAIEVDGKYYTVNKKTYLGVKGEDIVSIQKTPEGYLLDKKKSITRLENFMKGDNTENEILYYYCLPDWKISQSAKPQGASEKESVAAVRMGDELPYTVTILNQEEEAVVIPKGTIVTIQMAEGLAEPENVKAEGFDYVYDAQTRTITYTLKETLEVETKESIELQYFTKVEEAGVFESKANMSILWKRFESKPMYHTTVADLEITNTAKGDYADYTKKFKVTINLTDADGNALKNKNIVYEGGSLKIPGANAALENGTLVLDEKNEAVISLKHGQTITLKNLPYGCRYAVTQEKEGGYTTTYSGHSGNVFPGTDIPIVTDGWIGPEKFTNEYELKTLKQGGIFEYQGEYYVVCREYTQFSKTHAKQGPNGDVRSYYVTEKLTGVIHEMDEDDLHIKGIRRGDLVKYKGGYYVFNNGEPYGCNPKNDTATPPHYYKLAGGEKKLVVNTKVEITNLCETVSPTGINITRSNLFAEIFAVFVIIAVTAGGYSLKRKKVKSR